MGGAVSEGISHGDSVGRDQAGLDGSGVPPHPPGATYEIKKSQKLAKKVVKKIESNHKPPKTDGSWKKKTFCVNYFQQDPLRAPGNPLMEVELKNSTPL